MSKSTVVDPREQCANPLCKRKAMEGVGLCWGCRETKRTQVPTLRFDKSGPKRWSKWW